MEKTSTMDDERSSGRGCCRRLQGLLWLPYFPHEVNLMPSVLALLNVLSMAWKRIPQSRHPPTPSFPLAIPTASFPLSPHSSSHPNFQLPRRHEITELMIIKEGKTSSREEGAAYPSLCICQLLQLLLAGQQLHKTKLNEGDLSNLCSSHTSSALPFIVDNVHTERYWGVDVEVGRHFCASQRWQRWPFYSQ